MSKTFCLEASQYRKLIKGALLLFLTVSSVLVFLNNSDAVLPICRIQKILCIMEVRFTQRR